LKEENEDFESETLTTSNEYDSYDIYEDVEDSVMNSENSDSEKNDELPAVSKNSDKKKASNSNLEEKEGYIFKNLIVLKYIYYCI